MIILSAQAILCKVDCNGVESEFVFPDSSPVPFTFSFDVLSPVPDSFTFPSPPSSYSAKQAPCTLVRGACCGGVADRFNGFITCSKSLTDYKTDSVIF